MLDVHDVCLLYIKQSNIHIKSLFDNSTLIIIWSIFQYCVKRTMPPWKYINTCRTTSAYWLRSKPLSNSWEQLRWSKQLITLCNTCLDNLNQRSLPVRKQRYDQRSVNFTSNCTRCHWIRIPQVRTGQIGTRPGDAPLLEPVRPGRFWRVRDASRRVSENPVLQLQVVHFWATSMCKAISWICPSTCEGGCYHNYHQTAARQVFWNHNRSGASLAPVLTSTSTW